MEAGGSGASWLCYYKALQVWEASKVVPIDKLSVIITLVLAFVLLHEKFSAKNLIGCVLIYYYLHRVLHRILYYHDRNRSVIKSMDVSKMSDAIKVLIYCIIRYYHLDVLFEANESFGELRNMHPLTSPLVLDDTPLPDDSVYRAMNVVY